MSYPEVGPPRFQRLRPGQLFLLRPVDAPLLEATGPDGMTIFFVSFLMADWLTFASFVGIDSEWLTAPDPPMTTFDPGDQSALRPFETALERFLDAPAPIDLLEFWLAVIPKLLPTRRGRGSSSMPTWLSTSLAEMHAEENLRVGLPRFLQLSHRSGAYLSVNTKRYLGKTPTAVVNEIRLRHAAHLLSETNEDITTIARRCGFAQLSYFSNSFRRTYHVSPREYRSRSRTGFIYGLFRR